jgi:hypothetical protein
MLAVIRRSKSLDHFQASERDLFSWPDHSLSTTDNVDEYVCIIVITTVDEFV